MPIESGACTRTAIAMCKRLIDGLNWEQIPDHETPYFDQHITSLHYYTKLAIIYKGIDRQHFNCSVCTCPG